jgi:hypothetical protein
MKLMRNSGWLAHIRSDYIKRMIREKNVVYDSGVILITRHYRRKQSLGYKTFSLIGDWRICQILSENPGDGNAHKIITEFLADKRRVWLYVHPENKRAKKFYKQYNFTKVDTVKWGGYVYFRNANKLEAKEDAGAPRLSNFFVHKM